MALGAQPRDVLRMVMREGMRPVVIGLALGLVGVLALTKELASLLFAVSAADPETLAGVTFLFCVVSLAALYAPARRATKIDPVTVLGAD